MTLLPADTLHNLMLIINRLQRLLFNKGKYIIIAFVKLSVYYLYLAYFRKFSRGKFSVQSTLCFYSCYNICANRNYIVIPINS